MHILCATSQDHNMAGYKLHKPILICWLKWKENDGNEGQTDTTQRDSFLFAAPLLWATALNANTRILTLLYCEFLDREDLVSQRKVYRTLRKKTTTWTLRRWKYNEQTWGRKRACVSLPPLGRTGTILERSSQATDRLFSGISCKTSQSGPCR